MSWIWPANGATPSAPSDSTAWCALPPPCAAAFSTPRKPSVMQPAAPTCRPPGSCRGLANCMRQRSMPTVWCASEALEMSKSLLIISRQPPWSGPTAREALDIALAGGAFDLPIGMLFLDDGVFQLSTAQQPATLQQKDLGANLQALPMFGVEALYTSTRSLQERGLERQKLNLAVELLDDAGLTALVARYDQVITL